jgi:hypothetical protein
MAAYIGMVEVKAFILLLHLTYFLRWDLKMGQRGQLDKLPVAHSASVTTLDWCSKGGISSQNVTSVGVGGQAEAASNGHGWLVSGGLDRCVKVCISIQGPQKNVETTCRSGI